jgi:membrane glycosyltransferase
MLDSEAEPPGGFGLAHQLEDEIEECPPTIVLVRRRDDRWLAGWSRAEAVLAQPLDPLNVAETLADVLRQTPPEDRPR